MHKTGHTEIHAELHGPLTSIQLARLSVFEPCECDVTQAANFRLIYFTHRPPQATARASARWASNRFERMGDLSLIPVGEPFHARGGVGDATAIFVDLKKELVGRWLDDKFEWSDRALAASLDIQNSTLRELMVRLADEALNPGFASEAMVEALSIQLAIELVRLSGALGNEEVRGGIQAWRLRLIEERLAESPRAPTLSELAGLCNLSPRQLARTFRASRGMSIGNYISEKRVETAKRMLKTDKSIKTIAYEMGFKSTSGFCFSFRNATGQTPGQFRTEMSRRGTAIMPSTSAKWLERSN